MKKILIGGFQHETNTFSPVLTDYSCFATGDEWPGLTRHNDLITRFKQQCNIGISGIVHGCHAQHFDIVPATWCAASPSGKVTEDAYEKIVAMILEDIKNNPDIDGIALDLHGAMVTEHIDDGEGELLKRIRAITGPDLPIVVALDFHANLTQDMLQHATQMHIYKTYPHIDMFDTGVACINTLSAIFDHQGFTHKALRHTDYIMPLNAQCTLVDPFQSIYKKIAHLETQTQTSIRLAPGFALSDIADAGPSVAVYAYSQTVADEVANAVITLLDQYKKDYKIKLYSPLEAIEYAKTQKQKPVIFADTQDNSGAGGSSDTMGIFRALADTQTKNAIVAMIVDPESAQKAFASGDRSATELDLGEKADGCSQLPLTAEFTIFKVSNNSFHATPGSYYEGCQINIGPTAHVECEGVQAIISSKKMQAADRALFTHLGVDPNQFDILVLKSSVHFRADFMRISNNIIIVKSPGKALADLSELTYTRCRKEKL